MLSFVLLFLMISSPCITQNVSIPCTTRRIPGQGDGFKVVFGPQPGVFYNTFHHSPAQIQCVDFYRGESCVGFPKNLTDTLDPSHTLYTPIYNVGTFILDNLYFTPVTKYLDVETWELIDWGVACFNISSNQSCSTSYFPLNSATASGINTVTFSATIGLFPFGAGYWTVDLSMRFSCFDPLTLTSCGVIDFSSHLPPVYPTAASSPLVAIQDQDNHRIFVIVDYGSSSSRLNAVYGLCIDTNSLNVCDFPLSGPFEVSNGVSSFSSWVDQDSVFGPFFFYDTLGNVERLCYNSETGCYGCYDLRLYQTVNTEDSVSIRGIPFSLFFAQRNARVGSETLSGLLTSNQVGSRLYFSMFSNDGVGCWDFSLNGFCQTPSGVFGDVNEGFLSSNLDVQTRDYSTTYNPFDGCFYSIGDANVVWSFDSNGNTPCISLYPSTIQSTSMVVPVSGGNFSVDVLKNVSGIQSINYESLYIIDQSPGTGSFFVDPSFNGSIYFKASPNQCGYVNCTFGFCTLSFNPQNLTSTLSVHIFCPPKALNDTLECVAPLEAGHSTIINPLAKDNNPNNSSLVISILSYPSNASVMILPNGSFSITPEKGFQGYNTIEYQICDIFYQCSSAFVPFVVGPIVVANDDHIAIVNGEYGYVNASLNDQDIFGTLDLLTLSIIHPPDIGTAYSQLSLLGFITYFKDLTRTNYTTTLTYQICDSIDSSFNANRSLNHDTCQMDFFCAIANVTVIVQSFTYFPTLIPSSSHTAESTITASRTPSASISPPASQSHTNSISRSFSHTPSKSVSSSHSGTASVSLSSSSSPSISRAASPSPSASSVLISPSRSATQTHTPTFTTTSSGTASSSPLSPSPSSTPSFVLPQAPQPSNLPSVHPSRSGSQTPTISKSFSSSHSVSKSKSPSLSLSHRPSQSSSLTGSITETRTISVSKTSKPSTSATISSTASKSLSHSVSTSSTPSLGISPSGSRSPSTTISSTKSGTATQSAAASLSTSSSSRPSQTASTTISETTSNSAFITTSNSPSPSKVLQSLSPSQSPTLSLSQSPSRSLRPSESSSLAPTSTPSQSLTWSPSKPFLSQSSRITPEVTISPTTSPSPSSFLGIQVIASVSSSSTSIPCIPGSKACPAGNNTFQIFNIDQEVSLFFIKTLSLQEIGSITIILPKDDHSNTLQATILKAASLPAHLQDPIESPLLDFSFLRPVSGFTAEICLLINQTWIRNTSNLCLGFIDDSQNPPKWRCQDTSLTISPARNSFVCGTTPHFTNFAVLLEGGSVLGPNSNSKYRYFSGSVTSDVLISFGVLIGVFFVLLVLFAFFTMTSVGERIFYGREAKRIRVLKKAKKAKSTETISEESFSL